MGMVVEQKLIDALQIAIFIFISWAMFVVQQYSEDWLESLLMVMVVGIVLSNYTGRRAEFLHVHSHSFMLMSPRLLISLTNIFRCFDCRSYTHYHR
jgi:predicted membrane protein